MLWTPLKSEVEATIPGIFFLPFVPSQIKVAPTSPSNPSSLPPRSVTHTSTTSSTGHSFNNLTRESLFQAYTINPDHHHVQEQQNPSPFHAENTNRHQPHHPVPLTFPPGITSHSQHHQLQHLPTQSLTQHTTSSVSYNFQKDYAQQQGGGSYGPPKTTKVLRHVSVFVAPPELPYQNHRPKIRVDTGQPEKHVNIIFIKSPTSKVSSVPEVELPPSPEQKTVVYVLNKEQEESPGVIVNRPEPPKYNPPNVYFIKYKDGNKDVQREQQSGGHQGVYESHNNFQQQQQPQLIPPPLTVHNSQSQQLPTELVAPSTHKFNYTNLSAPEVIPISADRRMGGIHEDYQVVSQDNQLPPNYFNGGEWWALHSSKGSNSVNSVKKSATFHLFNESVSTESSPQNKDKEETKKVSSVTLPVKLSPYPSVIFATPVVTTPPTEAPKFIHFDDTVGTVKSIEDNHDSDQKITILTKFNLSLPPKIINRKENTTSRETWKESAGRPDYFHAYHYAPTMDYSHFGVVGYK